MLVEHGDLDVSRLGERELDVVRGRRGAWHQTRRSADRDLVAHGPKLRAVVPVREARAREEFLRGVDVFGRAADKGDKRQDEQGTQRDYRSSPAVSGVGECGFGTQNRRDTGG